VPSGEKESVDRRQQKFDVSSTIQSRGESGRLSFQGLKPNEGRAHEGRLADDGKGGLKLMLRVLFGALLVVCVVDIGRAWEKERVLSKAAREGARIAVSIPLSSPDCVDRTPCAIESAAEAVKNSLTNAGLSEASCITPKTPSFSGIVVWVYSCDGETACSSSSGAVCVKFDMTAVVAGKDGAWIPSTRVTVEAPHRWAVGSLVRLLPERLRMPLPKALSMDAVTANRG